MSSSPGARIPALLGIGLTAGVFSGLFGVGGGLIVVPGLVAVLGLEHRRAVGTSLLAITPAVLASLASYAVTGSVDLVVGGLLALGAVIGAQAGTWLLHRVSRRAAQWVFIAFVAAMVVQLFIVVPNRGAVITLGPGQIAGLVVLGLAAGTLSAILGIGGGGVVVPVLMFAFGLGDLAAKGASLVMMVPTLASGLWANLRRHNVDVRSGLVVGTAALVTGPVGAWVAHAIPAQVGSWLFAAFLLFVGASMVREVVRRSPSE
ncbi:MAG: sulfite exporter TauE/SafE family protein [Actinobacteria bacterium HGW-Actinobacteria-6]|nr:MAG: sulfite exporter TauE/SafE family protein [Actinobacteria bacterium HGW-Actinobacteria-6]